MLKNLMQKLKMNSIHAVHEPRGRIIQALLEFALVNEHVVNASREAEASESPAVTDHQREAGQNSMDDTAGATNRKANSIGSSRRSERAEGAESRIPAGHFREFRLTIMARAAPGRPNIITGKKPAM